MIDLERLNDHSRHFAHRLFRLWPEWIRYARFDPHEDFEKEALLLEVPRPCDIGGDGMFLTTSEWEVSIGFGANFHTRFGATGEPDAPDFYEDALRFLQDFVDERVVVATAHQDGEWLGAWKIDLREEKLEEIEVEEGVDVTIRSWQGTHDREMKS